MRHEVSGDRSHRCAPVPCAHRGVGVTGGPSRYDRQLIVALPANPSDDDTLRQAMALDAKARARALPSEVVALAPAAELPPAVLLQAMAGRGTVTLAMTPASRLYLVGVGDAQARSLSGRNGEAVADLLAAAGLADVAVISIVADGAGSDPDVGDPISPQSSSFASRMHRHLLRAHGIDTTVHARVGRVRVATDADAAGAGVEPGRKLTAAQGDLQPSRHKATHSKLSIRWAGDKQCREWSY